MRLKRVKLQNFLSYERLDFTFHEKSDEPPAIYIITGVNNDTDSSVDNSNGSGKSTLVGEAITFNLFGKNLRGSSKKVKLENAIKFGEATMINEAEYFIDESSVLKIHREKERDGKSSLAITVDGQEKSKRLKRLSETDIRDFLGIDPEVYYQTISYYKDNMSLLAMNYSQRLDFFKKLVNLAIMDEYYTACKKKAADLDQKALAARVKKQSINEIINALNNNDTKYCEIIQESIDKITSELDALKNTPEVDVSKYEEKLKELLEIKAKYETLISEVKHEMRMAKANIIELTQDVKRFSELKNTECPTCNQQVSGEYADAIILEKRRRIEALQSSLEDKEQLLESYSEKGVKCIEKEDTLRKKIDELKSANTIRRVKIHSLTRQLEEKKAELASVSKAIKTEEETNEYYLKLDKLEKVEEILARRKEINDFWLTNLAPKSTVRSAIIRKHINYLSDIFEYYLGKLFRNTIVGKMEIDDDGNIDIILQTDGNEVNYWNLSSGERKRADLALLFSLYVYLLNMVPDAPKFLIGDEIYDALDYPGKLYVTETIAEIYASYKIDIFIISHVDFPTEVFEGIPVKNILVTKRDGCSKAEYVLYERAENNGED